MSAQGFQSWIDATFASTKLAPCLHSWNVLRDTAMASDHFPISFHLSLHIPRFFTPSLDWRHVCWSSFTSTLACILSDSLPPSTSLLRPHDIDIYSMILSDCFQKAITLHVPVKRTCQYSNPWWSLALGTLRSKVIACKKTWMKHPTAENKRLFNNAKRDLKNNLY